MTRSKDIGRAGGISVLKSKDSAFRSGLACPNPLTRRARTIWTRLLRLCHSPAHLRTALEPLDGKYYVVHVLLTDPYALVLCWSFHAACSGTDWGRDASLFAPCIKSAFRFAHCVDLVFQETQWSPVTIEEATNISRWSTLEPISSSI